MTQTQYPPPPNLSNTQGQPRKVGFELEFSGISIAETMKVLQSFGANAKEILAVEAKFEHELGVFNLELDAAFIKNIAKDNEFQTGDSAWFDLLTQAASLVVPVEIVCPPIPVTQLHQLDSLLSKLRESGAVGTSESPLAAYGVHINTEAPSLDVATLYQYLLAFCLMQWWLVEAHEVDLTRRLSPFVDLFPENYLRHLIEQGQPGDVKTFIRDYIQFNPTRNRALDMLPLFSWIDSALVQSHIDSELVKKRPTFHYRLPNCHIEKAHWSLRNEWRLWLEVEKLANDSKALMSLARNYSESHKFLLGVNRKQWVETIELWRQDH